MSAIEAISNNDVLEVLIPGEPGPSGTSAPPGGIAGQKLVKASLVDGDVAWADDFQFASQAEAEAGTDNTKITTSLRVAQAISARINNTLTSTSTTLALSAAQGKALQDSKAPLASPALTGTPTAPTAAADTNSTRIATTAFVVGQAGSAAPLANGAAAAGTSLRFARQDHVHPTDETRAPLVSPSFGGVPSAPTAAVDTNTTQLATTAFVVGQGYLKASAAAANYAPLASPTLTGTPAAPTAAADTSTTQLATTAFVAGQAGSALPLGNGAAAAGTSLRFARQDHVHPSDSSRAPLASPSLTGTPTAPTAAADTNTTQLATTAFVVGQAGSALPLTNGTAATGTSLRFARQDHVHPSDTSRAPLASPALTGTPTAPTAAVDTNTNQLATTAFVAGQAGSALPLGNGAATAGTSLRFARQDHVHPTDSTLAPLASPALTGTPTAPTASVGTSTTQLATTAFVVTEIASSAPTKAGSGASGTWAISISGNAAAATYAKQVPIAASAAAYTLAAADAGRCISTTAGGITVPAGVLLAGDVISIYNDSATGQTITQGSGVTLRQAGTANTGNRTLGQNGIATILCVAPNTFVISGAGLT